MVKNTKRERIEILIDNDNFLMEIPMDYSTN